MKKHVLVLGVCVALGVTACKKEVEVNPTGATNTTANQNTNVAEDVRATNVNLADLPANALNAINQFYEQENIATYEIKNIPIVGKSYEVKFNDGAEVGFDENGNWHEWKDAKGLPDGILPVVVKEYVAKNYANTFATSIDKEDNKIKVELASDVDLEFDVNGKFLRIDK